jgi:hypothetical protein
MENEIKFKQIRGAHGIASWKSGANGSAGPARYEFPGGVIMKTHDRASAYWDVYFGRKLVNMGLSLSAAKLWVREHPPKEEA